MSSDSPSEQSNSRLPNAVSILFIVIVLIAGVFFIRKLYDLAYIAMYLPDGAFAISPVVNYVLAGLGFLCMFGWAAYNGMFHDIEKPKQTMLDTEHQLDGTSEPYALWKKK